MTATTTPGERAADRALQQLAAKALGVAQRAGASLSPETAGKAAGLAQAAKVGVGVGIAVGAEVVRTAATTPGQVMSRGLS